MITIQSGKMIIPENERFVGFAGDNLTRTKQFLVPNAADSDSAYILYLRFDDDRVASAVLEKSNSGSDLVLTWNVRAEHMLKSGVILAQIKITDGEVTVAHTGCDYFVAARSTELNDDGVELDIISRTEFERRMGEAVAEARATAPYIGDDGYWYVYSPEEGDYVRSWSAGAVADSEISATSTNPVQNKVVKAYVDAAAAGIPTALSQLTNDSGYIRRYVGSAAPPSSGTTESYPVPCIWEYYDESADATTFWLVYHRSEITVPGSPSQYYYDFIEINESNVTGVMLLANTSNAVPPASGTSTPDYSSTAFRNLEAGQMFRCVLGSGLDTVQSYWIKTGSLSAVRIALYSNIPANIPTKTSDLTNDSGYLTLSTLPVYNGGVQ